MPKTINARAILGAGCLWLTVAAGCISGAEEPPAAPTTPTSPRLLALAAQVHGGDASAVEKFWEEIAKQRTPLVEPAPADANLALVTFLWRGDPGTRGVFLLGSLSGEALLARLDGTNVWFRSYTVRKDARFTYRLAPFRGAVPKEPGKIRETATVDPLNPRRHPPAGPPLLSVAELPDAPAQPWISRRPGTPAGVLKEGMTIKSAVLGGRRPVTVYTPPGYEAGAGPPYPLMIVFDGTAYRDLIPLPTILDNLIAAGRIPPVVAVLIGQLEAEERESDLSCNREFTRFLAEELLPWSRKGYRVTSEPGGVVLVGSSLGGLAAACAAMERPDLFGNVLSQSGAFWWKPEGDSEFEWLVRQFASRPRLPLRFYLDVGSLEARPGVTGLNLYGANHRLEETLRAKGYDLLFAEYIGGHSYANWQGTISDGLIFLLKR
jgi:enterochelin esterase-like enzyme